MTTLRRCLAILLVGGTLVLGALVAGAGTAVATIGATTTCNNGLGNGGAVCEIVVVNTITPTGGSAFVTVHECQGSAGVPDATCVDSTASLTSPVTAVNQCNGSISGGGGTLRCSLVFTNNFVGFIPDPVFGPVTVNQCVGSADMGSAMACDPFPATDLSATITQCNGSANGGGSVLTCSAIGTEASAHPVTITQCNGSANGGNALLVCSATINNIVNGGPTPTPTPTPTPGVTPTPTPTPTPGVTPTPTPTPTPGVTPTPTPLGPPAGGGNPGPAPTPTPGVTPTGGPAATAMPGPTATSAPILRTPRPGLILPPTDAQAPEPGGTAVPPWAVIAIVLVAMTTLAISLIARRRTRQRDGP